MFRWSKVLYCCFYVITYSGSMQKHAEFVPMLCRVCGMYCSSTRSIAPTYQCSDYVTELSMVFGINSWVNSVATHPTSFCYACCSVIERYQTAMRLGKICRHLTNLLDGWRAHADQNCTFCEYASRIRKGGRPKKKTLPGHPFVNPTRTLLEHIRRIATSPSCTIFQ